MNLLFVLTQKRDDLAEHVIPPFIFVKLLQSALSHGRKVWIWTDASGGQQAVS
ncbi:hypothetical protein SynA1560_02615 [Synechococcus sp. A15-60]|nr:hypothetical protein SynA1560_02615 [Synechococcus sp. A15-60]